MTFGERLRACRRARGISQRMLSYKSGVHLNNIGNYERDEFEPTLHNAAKLAQALGVSLDYLAGLKDEQIKYYLEE